MPYVETVEGPLALALADPLPTPVVFPPFEYIVVF
jgi:hypothetical protein